jgi:hypothetical protein
MFNSLSEILLMLRKVIKLSKILTSQCEDLMLKGQSHENWCPIYGLELKEIFLFPVLKLSKEKQTISLAHEPAM